MDAAPPSRSSACLNCGTPFGEPRPNFCPVCGQEATIRPPTLGELVRQFGGAYFSTEGALWRTLGLLLFRPGELTRQYLAGRRKHYVLPLRLYLTASVVVLLLLRLSVAVQVAPVLDQAGIEALANEPVSISMLFGRVQMKDGVFTCVGLPQWLCGRLHQRMAVEPKAVFEELRRVGDRLTGNWGGAMFVLMPCFAFALWLLYRNRRMHYTEHLVFALHLHAFWFPMLAVAQIHFLALDTIALAAIPVYAVLAMRRVYGGRWAPLALRATVLSLVYVAMILLAIVILALVALLL
jgi:hypothetical protein